MKSFILGGGVTGISAGWASGLPVFEAARTPGGICASYYLRPGGGARLVAPPPDGEAYRFEIGGGHWIFGGDPVVLRFLGRLTPMKTYQRASSIFFPDTGLTVPYPLQNNLRYLDRATARRALAEMERPLGSFKTMREWLSVSFGPTLCRLFFHPFHALYTAGLDGTIAPQDAYKSPLDIKVVRLGAGGKPTPQVGYNTAYLYPEEGLGKLSQAIAAGCDIRYGKRATRIDARKKTVSFTDGTRQSYDTLLCTLPLNRTMELAGLTVDEPPHPSSSVLVLNIGAVKGPRCPKDHWLYLPKTRSGFHRVGFYSNVDRSFLPRSARAKGDRVSIYVERAFREGEKPSDSACRAYGLAVASELREWGFIEETDVIDPTWIDVAYTWSLPGSRWTKKAQAALERHGILPIGRYGRWSFQGIAESVEDGLFAGGALRP